MTQYLLAVHHSPTTPQPTPETMEQAFAQVEAFNADLTASGSWVFAGGLEPPDIATVVTNLSGEELVTDGPFGESKEHLGGFWIIDVADLDVALGWAQRASAACMGPVEVRPFQGG